VPHWVFQLTGRKRTLSARAVAGLRRSLETSFAGRCVRTFIDLQGVDRAMAIAAQSFTALIPLLLLTSALAPTDRQDLVSRAIIDRFDLRGDAALAVQTLFAQSPDTGTGMLSVVLLVFSGVSLTRRIQGMYLKAWRFEAQRGLRGSADAALALAALLVEIALLSLARSLVGGLPLGGLMGVPVSALAGLVLWTSVPWLLLDRRVHWRRLVPGGALAGVLSSIYGVVSTIYMPRLMESYSQRFGLFGVTLALVGWLLSIALIVVTATVVASEFDRAQEPWARHLRRRLRVEAVEHGPSSQG
jgi:membrane protein